MTSRAIAAVDQGDLLALGAEARVELVNWDGRPSVRKIRAPKGYRDTGLDQRLRQTRTREESRIIHLAKIAGVVCPVIFFVDPYRFEIVMSHMEGEHLRDVLSSVSVSELADLCNGVGRIAAKMHRVGIIHGDLTTKNIIVSEGSGLAVVDFGLSFHSDRVEDRAEDIHLLKQALKSMLDEAKLHRAFVEVMRGYSSLLGELTASQVARQIGDIERRGRYAKVD